MSITPYQPAGSVELCTYGEPGIDLEQWAVEAGQVHKIATALANTSFVPVAMQGRPDEIAAQILYGREVGMSPMVALAHINIIERRPSMSALSMRGLAQSKGVKFRLDESTETRCKMSALAPGDSNWTTVLWTIDRAKKLELTGKKNWLRQPQAMLIARATSELCRLVAAPLFLGLSYSSEELRDGVDEFAELSRSDDPPPSAPAPQEPQRTVRRKPLPEQPKPEPKPEPEPVPGSVSANTRKALMATFNTAGITDRDTRLAYVCDLLKRPVLSVNECTEQEARHILDQLHLDFPSDTKHADEWDDAPVPAVAR